MKTRYADIPAFVTKDGSIIRELMHPAQHSSRHQSLAETATAANQVTGRTSEASRASESSRGPRLISIAEAIVEPGQHTALHQHHVSEEIYHITAGTGRMRLGSDEFDVLVGDTICIPPGTPHCITNTSNEPLRILCCCAPPYSHDDTEVLA